MFQKTLTLILALGSLFFIGYGITGFATMGSHSLCIEDLDCQYSVCCPVHDSEYGVCAQKADCSGLYFEYEDGNVKEAAPSVSETAERSYIAVVLGVIILMILAIVGYFEWKSEKSLKKRVKKR
jgi:hypothetical protein